MTLEIDQLSVLKDFTSRLEKLGIEYMLTGSMALVHYAMPRTTVDIDLVVDLSEKGLESFVKEFQEDYYIPLSSARRAVRDRRMFNAINQESIVKIDCVILKESEFAREAFGRRRKVEYSGDFRVSIISKEDLILSKLQWAKKGDSERQKRDVGGLVRTDFNEEYVNVWSKRLGVEGLLKEVIENSRTDDP